MTFTNIVQSIHSYLIDFIKLVNTIKLITLWLQQKPLANARSATNPLRNPRLAATVIAILFT